MNEGTARGRKNSDGRKYKGKRGGESLAEDWFERPRCHKWAHGKGDLLPAMYATSLSLCGLQIVRPAEIGKQQNNHLLFFYCVCLCLL